MGHLRQRLFGISPREVSFARRGFQQGSPSLRLRLERIGQTFLHGYHAALLDDHPATLARRLATIDPEFCGFAFEGAAMGLALMDDLAPWRKSRLQAFLDGPGAAHAYMVHVGAGWALARLHRRAERPLTRLDPLLGWLAMDGYGFHEGYFHWPRFVRQHTLPRKLAGYALRVFDQGLGRSLWFVEGADVARIPVTIAAFPLDRQADLWSGIGLAAVYAGGVEPEAVAALLDAAGSFQPELAQGAAFAAKARQRAGNPTAHTEQACQIVCGTSAEQAADLTDRALQDLPSDGEEPAFEIWRRRLQAHFAEERTVEPLLRMSPSSQPTLTIVDPGFARLR